ncbi:hypothetical protein TNIN_154711 [Trichonephila inaurata madagascariensis]|uniref:Uncharacterized protein n=1 Tax=Trichonephila inaurata madagascariensis TaxID=2747483 RepID=A0A8X7CM26_9ARAC|nr:hypothetical protein TNIN_154711 [Trichonephila inaurata madagascariensis]
MKSPIIIHVERYPYKASSYASADARKILSNKSRAKEIGKCKEKERQFCLDAYFATKQGENITSIKLDFVPVLVNVNLPCGDYKLSLANEVLFGDYLHFNTFFFLLVCSKPGLVVLGDFLILELLGLGRSFIPYNLCVEGY